MPALEASPTLRLRAVTAADLMVPNPVSIREDALVREAIVLLTDKGFSAAPVIDAAGRPVGVLSRSDILVHQREKVDYVPGRSEYYEAAETAWGFQVENIDPTLVREMMTPAVFSVTPDAPVAKVIDEMLALHVHRLFVVDKAGVLVGVISALDVVRHLRP
jgi:CBS domain-containing protein